jgi:hypothetical protein
MLNRDDLLTRIDQLLALKWHGEQAYDVVGEVYAGTIALSAQLWGDSSSQVEAVKQLRADMQSSIWSPADKAEFVVLQCHGVLRGYASDIEAGRLGSLRLEYQGQVFADLVNSAKAAVDAGAKHVGAVLAAVSLEDTLKRFAEAKGLDVDDSELSDVINALKAAGLLSAPQGALLKGMVPFRNKALHAEWSEFAEADVRGVLAFVEEFLMRNFG